MVFVVIGLVALAVLAAISRRPLANRSAWRFLAVSLALANLVAAVWVSARGAWLDGVILAAAAAWIWVSTTPASGASRPADMSRSHAAAKLGVAETANLAEIDAAYRRLMLRVHPDQGGAAGLAAELNRAREVLVAGLR